MARERTAALLYAVATPAEQVTQATRRVRLKFGGRVGIF